MTNCLGDENMESVYKTITLRLVLAISKALDKLDEGDHAAARKILSDAWKDVAGETPALPLR